MYVKVYSYHVDPDRAAEYLKIQQKAEKIYSEYTEKTAIHLNSKQDPTKWMEVHQYVNKETYLQTMEKVNARPEIIELYTDFQGVLINGGQVTEEDYIEVELYNCCD